ncbi:MAG TPA: hypothetical protein VNL18_05035 [Gemmatimonadales bacterium]|nr:hypothetical protein [Gemmatimonadales bacterium]
MNDPRWRWRIPGRPTVTAVGVLLVGAAAPARAQEDTLLAPAVFEVGIHQGPSDVISALVYNSTLLLPIRTFVEMTELRLETYAARDSVVIVLEPSKLRVKLDPARGRLTLGDTLIPLGAYDAVWWDGDMYVATQVIDRAFGTATAVAWANLSALVGKTTMLPVVQRQRRERRRSQLVVSRTEPEALELHPTERLADGAVLSWSLFAATDAPQDDYSLDLGLGGRLFGGSLEMRPRLRVAGDSSDSRLEASWSRAWTDRRWLRQVRLGDVQSNGRRSRFIEGFMVTNAPFVRSSEFEVEQVAGTIPPGWEVELYERGRLLAYQEMTARGGVYRMPLKLRYGQNPFELVLYGPAGEVVRQRRTVRVPFSRLPTGQWEYALAGGGCRFDPCDGIVSADARYGVSSRFTLQGGWDAFFRGDTSDVWQPYLVASGAPLPPLSLTGEAVVNGHLRAAAAFEPHEDLRAELGYTAFSESGLDFAGTFAERHRTEASLFWHPGLLRGALYVQANSVRSSAPGSSRAFDQASASARLGRVRYSVGLRRDAFRRAAVDGVTRFAVELGGDALLSGPWRWVRNTTMRGSLSVDPADGLNQLSVSLARKVRNIRADLGLGWSSAAGVTLDVGIASALRGRPRVGTRNRFSSGSGTDGIMFMSGSAAWDPDARYVRLSDGSDLGRGGVTGTLFLDDNGNGRRDPREPGIEGIPVHVGGWLDETDADGRFTTWDLVPYEQVTIDVDSLSFDNPLYVLPARVIRVRPSPNSFISVEIPVVTGAELAGVVLLDGEGVGGVPIVFRDLNTGQEISATTYADGGFYKAGVPPGEWEVTLPETVAEHLNVFVPPMHIVILPGSGDKRFEDLILRLEPR